MRSQRGDMAEKRDGEAQGGVDWKRIGWPDAGRKCEVRSVNTPAASEEGREITKKAARDPQMTLFEHQQLTDSRVCRQWFGPRRAVW